MGKGSQYDRRRCNNARFRTSSEAAAASGTADAPGRTHAALRRDANLPCSAAARSFPFPNQRMCFSADAFPPRRWQCLQPRPCCMRQEIRVTWPRGHLRARQPARAIVMFCARFAGHLMSHVSIESSVSGIDRFVVAQRRLRRSGGPARARRSAACATYRALRKRSAQRAAGASHLGAPGRAVRTSVPANVLARAEPFSHAEWTAGPRCADLIPDLLQNRFCAWNERTLLANRCCGVLRDLLGD